MSDTAQVVLFLAGVFLWGMAVGAFVSHGYDIGYGVKYLLSSVATWLLVAVAVWLWDNFKVARKEKEGKGE